MKKLIAIISAAVIVAAMLVPAAFAAQTVYGDVTGDGKADSIRTGCIKRRYIT